MLRRLIAIAMLGAFVPLTTTACFGTFPTARKVYRWNANVHSDKWVRWLVFLAINIVPVYFSAAVFDMIFSNSVEFWTGTNPMAAVPGTTRTVLGPNGERATLTVANDHALDVVLTAPGVAEERFRLVREVAGIAAYDANGILMARVGDGPDGEPALLAGAFAR